MPRPIPTDLLLYELPHYPSNATRAEHFESRADLRGADLQDARFERCDLTGADFRGATTDGLAFIGCPPTNGADFRGAEREEVAP